MVLLLALLSIPPAALVSSLRGRTVPSPTARLLLLLLVIAPIQLLDLVFRRADRRRPIDFCPN